MATSTASLKGNGSPNSYPGAQEITTNNEVERESRKHLENKLRRKVDLRLCSIAGILCSLNLLDSGIISSASVTRLVHTLR